MTASLFKIMFTGKLQSGYTSEHTVDALAALLKVDKTYAKQLVSGKPVTLQQQLPRARAEITRDKLQKAGAEVMLIPAIKPVKASPDEQNHGEKPTKEKEPLTTKKSDAHTANISKPLPKSRPQTHTVHEIPNESGSSYLLPAIGIGGLVAAAFIYVTAYLLIGT